VVEARLACTHPRTAHRQLFVTMWAWLLPLIVATPATGFVAAAQVAQRNQSSFCNTSGNGDTANISPARLRSIVMKFAANDRSRKSTLKRLSRPWSFENGSVVVDVGSNVGADIVRLTRSPIGPRARRKLPPGSSVAIEVHTFEPIPSIRAVLKSRLDESGIPWQEAGPDAVTSPPARTNRSSVTIHPTGLGASIRTACFASKASHAGKGLLRYESGKATSATAEDTSTTGQAATGECAQIVDAASVVRGLSASGKRIALLHMNCQGWYDNDAWIESA
jgi:hypothetical protein